MRIALDIDGTLAATHEISKRRSDLLDNESFQSWGLNGLVDHYLEISQNAWVNDWKDIEPMEPNIDLKVGRLRDNHTVDILTARTGVDEQIRNWLDYHDIPYDTFTATSRPKREFDYDAFVDDKPGMVGDVDLLYLRDRPYNRDVPDEDDDVIYYVAWDEEPVLPSAEDDRPFVARVSGIGGVIHDLRIRDDRKI